MIKTQIVLMLAITLVAGCVTTTAPVITSLPEQRILPNGDINEVNVDYFGTRKRIRIQIDPRGNTIPDAEVRAAFSFNRATAHAMDDPQSASVFRQTGTSTTPSIFAADIPCENLHRCDWFHYRWSLHYQLPGHSGLNNFVAGAVKPFLIGGTVGSITEPSPPCDPIP